MSANQTHTNMTKSLNLVVDIDELEMMIESGSDLERVYNQTRLETPLLTHMFSRRYEIANFLLDYGANPNAQCSNGFTPLMLACQHAQVSLIKKMINQNHEKVILRIQNSRGYTALHFAAMRQEEDVLEAIFESATWQSGQCATWQSGQCATWHVINVQNEVGKTPLHVAAETRALVPGNQTKRISRVAKLLENKAFAHIEDKFGKLPMDYLTENEEDNVIREMLKTRFDERGSRIKMVNGSIYSANKKPRG